jgi:hypothetical protein
MAFMIMQSGHHNRVTIAHTLALSIPFKRTQNQQMLQRTNLTKLFYVLLSLLHPLPFYYV